MRDCGSYGVFLEVLGFLFCCMYDSSVFAAMYQSFIGINQDGSIGSANQIPACDNGRIIHLMRITFFRRSCSSICLSVPSEKVSAELQGHLYEICSYKERCTNMRFPQTTIQLHQTTGVNVSYGCLDPTKNFVDICKKKATFFSSETHLTAIIKSSFKECRCFINGGKFTIAISDLRLQSKAGRNCSSAALQIDSKDYDCSKPGYEDIFSKSVKNDVSKAFISMNSATDAAAPKMLWLTLRPKDNSLCSVECYSITRYSSTNSYLATPSTKAPETLNPFKHTAASSKESSTQIKWTGLVIVAIRFSVVTIM